jgi:integrase
MTGCRRCSRSASRSASGRAEALGLKWTDFDLDGGTLTIRHALQRVDGELKLVEPKSDRSRRTGHAAVPEDTQGRGAAAAAVSNLRHAAASLLLAQGVNPRVVMEILGHSQISLTLNTYSHVIPSLQREAASRMDAVLGETR